MRNKIKKAILTCALVLSAGMTASADELAGSDDWAVEFTADKQMVSNFSADNFEDVLDDMQPGDSASFQVQLTNSYSSATDWYMTNEVLRSLEDASKTATGGVYSYLLTYTDAEGTVTTIYDSDTVGGEEYEDSEGLHEATDALEEYFYLDTLSSGETGAVALWILLDGETQGNDYQDTLAQLQMNFAVELPVVTEEHKTVYDEQERTVNKHITKTSEDVYITEDGTPTSVITTITDDDTPTSTFVKTGDTTQLALLLVAAGVLGALLLALAIYGMKLRKKLKDTAGMLLLAGVLSASMLCPMSADAAVDYQYTVRIFAGAQGTFADGTTQITIKTTPTSLDLSDVIDGIVMNDASKYYVKGIRESGRDNTELVGTVYEVTHDVDLVVAYGMKAADVQYTVQYLKADTLEELYPTQTYYGNIGDKPVVAFQYVDSYVPQAYNLTKTLSSDASENVFTFLYTYNPNGGYRYYETDGGVRYIDREGETIVDYVPGKVIYQQSETVDEGVTDNGVTVQEPAQTAAEDSQTAMSADQAAASEQQNQTSSEQHSNVIIYGEEIRDTETESSEQAQTEATVQEEAAETDETVQEPQNLIDLDDEETPLAQGQSEEVTAGSNAVLIGVLAAAAMAVVAVGAFLFTRKKKLQSKEESQKNEK